MLIQEAIKKAEAVNGGIMNKAAKVNGVYYSPIGNFDSFLIVPIGQTILLANCHIFVSTDTPYLCIILFSYCRAFQR